MFMAPEVRARVRVRIRVRVRVSVRVRVGVGVRVRALTLTLTALHLAARHDVEGLGLVAHRIDHLVRLRAGGLRLE